MTPLPLIDLDELINGGPVDFQGVLTVPQIEAVKTALNESPYRALSLNCRDAVQQDIVDACLEICEEIGLNPKDDRHFKGIVWMMKKYIEHVLSLAYGLTRVQ